MVSEVAYEVQSHRSNVAPSQPGPVSINGDAMPIVYGNHANGIYRGCTSRNVSTSRATAGTTLTMYFNVSLTPMCQCATNSHVIQFLFCLVYKLPPLYLTWIQSCTPTTLIAGPHGTNTKLQISLYLLSSSLFTSLLIPLFILLQFSTFNKKLFYMVSEVGCDVSTSGTTAGTTLTRSTLTES